MKYPERNFRDPPLEVFFVAKPLLSPLYFWELWKPATTQPVAQLVVRQMVRHIFCRKSLIPSINEFVHLHWGYKFFWISAVFPVSRATVVQFHWVRVWFFYLKTHENLTIIVAECNILKLRINLAFVANYLETLSSATFNVIICLAGPKDNNVFTADKKFQ